jgi:putative hydrolase of the HAD superfamily
VSVKAVGFDVDGTLYPSYQMVFSAITSFLNAPRLMFKFAEVRREIREITYDGDLRDMQANLMARKLGVDQETAKRRIERELYRRWERSFRFIRPFSGVRETLLSLRRSGYLLAALSDFPVEDKLRYLGVEDIFDLAMSSEETGYLKPHEVPFLHLARRLGVAPEEVLYVGNSAEYDVQGAGSVGMKTAHIAKGGNGEEKADFVFTDFYRLRDWIISGMGETNN